MATATVIKTFVADTPVYNGAISPFQADNHITAFSAGTPVLYGANRPRNDLLTKYRIFRQSISGNKAFALGSTINTPVTGAVTTANHLRGVGIVAGTIKKRAVGTAVAPASSFIFAAGGGTAAGEAGLTTDGVLNVVGATSLVIEDDGANTETILVGDTLTVAGDTTIYYATATTTSLNGTTGVAVAITPPLQVAAAAGVAVTITAADGKTAIFADAAGVGQDVEVWVLDATDITTIATLVASTPTDIVAYDAMIASAAATIHPQAKG